MIERASTYLRKNGMDAGPRTGLFSIERPQIPVAEPRIWTCHLGTATERR